MKTKDQPWVSNYPALDKLLKEGGARCMFQLRLGGDEDEPTGYVEQHMFPNGKLAIVVVHARQHGWDIYTPCGSNKIDETLADAKARLK